MSRLAQKIKYKIKDIGAAIAGEGELAVMYWLYFSTRPFIPKIYSSLPIEEFYKRNNFRQQLFRLHKKGYVRRIGDSRKAFFIFNRDLRFRFLGESIGIREEKFKEGWDKKWRLVIYDIPNKYGAQRSRLRIKLSQLGFGKIQDSCWACCYDYADQIHEFCKERNILDHICIYEGSFFAGMDDVKLIESAWHLNEFNTCYDELIKETGSFIREVETRDLPLKDSYRIYCDIFYRYRQLLERDPFLPKEFSGIYKAREQLEKCLFKLFSLIAEIPGLNM